MANRRTLTEGLKQTTELEARERAFVFGEPKAAAEAAPGNGALAKAGEPGKGSAPARAPLTTRLRADFADALKRASLERQLAGKTPNKVQEILEEALGPWLKQHGYLP